MDHYTIRVRQIKNGYTASYGKSEDYKSAESEPEYFATLADVHAALSDMLTEAAALEIREDAGPDF